MIAACGFFAAGYFFVKIVKKRTALRMKDGKLLERKTLFSDNRKKLSAKTVGFCIKIPKIFVKFSAERLGETLVSSRGFVYTMKWDGIWLSHIGNIQNTRYRCRGRKTGLFAVRRRVCICFFSKKDSLLIFCFTKKQQSYSDYLYYHQKYETGGLLWKI